MGKNEELPKAIIKHVNLLEINYTNYRGETSKRRLVPMKLWWGTTKYHKEDQWFLHAHDLDKKAERDFALKDFGHTPPITDEEIEAGAEASLETCKETYGPYFKGDKSDVDGLHRRISRSVLEAARKGGG